MPPAEQQFESAMGKLLFRRFVWASEQLWDGESTTISPDPEIEVTRRFGYIRHDETNRAVVFFGIEGQSLIGLLLDAQIVREESTCAIFGYNADDEPVCWIIEPREVRRRLP